MDLCFLAALGPPLSQDFFSPFCFFLPCLPYQRTTRALSLYHSGGRQVLFQRGTDDPPPPPPVSIKDRVLMMFLIQKSRIAIGGSRDGENVDYCGEAMILLYETFVLISLNK